MSRIVVDARWYSPVPVWPVKPCGGLWPNEVHRWNPSHPQRLCQCGKWESYMTDKGFYMGPVGAPHA